MSSTNRDVSFLSTFLQNVGLRAALCDYCDGVGFVHQDDGEHFAITLLGVPHKAALPGIEPCVDCEPCPECGRNGCGSGVRWVEVEA